MRYRLRTLMIVLGVGPPILAALVLVGLQVLPDLIAFAVLAFYLGIALTIFLAFFAPIWFACGFVWLLIMRVVEPLFETKAK